MKLLAYESVDRPIVEYLRQEGHDVEFIAEIAPGIADPEVLARAWQAGVILLTADKDFGELVYRQRLPHAGVLLLRFAGLSEEEKCQQVADVLQNHQDLGGAFSVLNNDVLRIRREP